MNAQLPSTRSKPYVHLLVEERVTVMMPTPFVQQLGSVSAKTDTVVSLAGNAASYLFIHLPSLLTAFRSFMQCLTFNVSFNNAFLGSSLL